MALAAGTLELPLDGLRGFQNNSVFCYSALQAQS
jgi:hypothetical protein